MQIIYVVCINGLNSDILVNGEKIHVHLITVQINIL